MSKNKATFMAIAALSILAIATAAWACTPTGYLELYPTYGPPGTVVDVTGSLPVEDKSTVQIRWNSPTGPLLATTQTSGPAFSAAITIPNAPYETYTIVAQAPTTRAVAQFTISDRIAPKRQSSELSDQGEWNTTTTGGDSSGGADSEPGSSQTTGSTNTGGASQTIPQGSEQTGQDAGPVSNGASSPVERAAVAQPRASAATAAQSGAAPAPSSGPAATAAADLQLPKNATRVSSDLWSGFDSRNRTLEPGQILDPQAAQQPSPALLAGMVMLGFGAVLGVAGLSMAVAHKRRRALV